MNKPFISKLIPLIGVSLLILLLSGCAPRFFQNTGLPNVAVVAHTPATSQVPAPGTDAQFVLVDDYLIMEEPLLAQNYTYGTIGKMLTAPTQASDNAGRFLRVMDGTEIWTKYFAKTRIANSSDYILTKEVLFADLTNNLGIYRAPENRTEAKNSWWFKARITDISEINRGYVMVSGGYKVNLSALRVGI